MFIESVEQPVAAEKGVAISLVADREMSRLQDVENERGTGAMKLWRADSMDDSASKATESMPEPVYMRLTAARKQKLRPETFLAH